MAPAALISSSKDANKSNMQENSEKWDVDATNIFFPKLTPITFLMKENIAQNNSVKL